MPAAVPPFTVLIAMLFWLWRVRFRRIVRAVVPLREMA